MRIEKSECSYQVTECDLKFGEQITLDGELLIPVSVLEDIRAEIQEIYVGYRHGYEVMSDVLQIIDNAKWMNKVLQGQSNIEADTPSCDTCKYQSAQFNPCNGCNDKSEYMPRADKE